jgi:hypothetical protein
MNWAPEALRAEMDYRVERAIGGDSRTTREHVRAAQQAHQSWWQRHRPHHTTHDDEAGYSRAA